MKESKMKKYIISYNNILHIKEFTLYSTEHLIYMNSIIEENTIVRNGRNKAALFSSIKQDNIKKKKDFTLMKFCIAMT